MSKIDIIMRDGLTLSSDDERYIRQLITRICDKVFERYGIYNPSVCVLITEDEEIRQLNKEWRNIDMSTDVLSFPFLEEISKGGFLGDVAISIEKAKKQSELYGHSQEREIAFLALHGMLHLMGMDHENEKDEQKMKEEQDSILKKLGYLRMNDDE